MDYYKKVKNSEHMLYADELAEMFGIITKTGNPAIQFISALLKQKMEMFDKEQLYFYARNTMKKVYPACIYLLAFKELKAASKQAYKDNDGYITVKVFNARNFYIKLLETDAWNRL